MNCKNEGNGLTFWRRETPKKGQSGLRKRDAIRKLPLAAPLSSQLYGCAAQMVALIEHRNDWAHCVNALNPDLPEMFKQEVRTRFVFEKFQRTFVLTFHAKDGVWDLDLLIDKERGEGGVANTPPTDHDGGGAADGGAGEQRPKAPVVKIERGDEYRPISAVPRRTPVKQASRTAFMWRAVEAARRSPRFRHIASLVKGTIAQTNEALRRFAGPAQNALLLGLGWDAGVNTSATRCGHFVQDGRFGALHEPQVVKRAGRTLTVWIFSPYPKPNWESWLFGRLIEDQQIAA